MNVLVSGSSGLIGGWVCNALRDNGFIPVGLDVGDRQPYQNWLEFFRCDILDEKSLMEVFDKVQPQAVIHLAARTDLNETKDLKGYATNIDGVRNLLMCVKKSTSVSRVIVTSSQLVCRVGYVPKNDKDYCPNTLYGESKVLTEKITEEMDGGGKEWCLVRPTTVWGPGMSPHYQRALSLVRRGRFFHCGSGKLYKSYSYAGNIAFQYLKLLQAPVDRIQRQTFYLADYTPLSLRDYMDGLAKAMNAPVIPTIPLPVVKTLALIGDGLNTLGLKKFPFNGFRLRNILTEYQFDLSKTRDVCGELPFSFEDGIKATAEWFLSQKNRCCFC